MNKGLLFIIPILVTILVAYTTMSPVWSAIALLGTTGLVFFYIRRQKHDNNEPGRKP